MKAATMATGMEEGFAQLARAAIAAVIAAAAAWACAGLSGCAVAEGGEADAQPESVAVVVGAHANAPQPKTSDAAAYLRTAVETNSAVAVVTAEGEPRVAAAGDAVGSTANTSAKRAEENEQWEASLQAALGQATAQTPEVDTLSAIATAARAIAEAPGAHRVVVMDSGLSTAGALDFTQGSLIDADPAEVAAWLRESGELPDLSGVAELDWYGLGDVAAPQQALTEAQRAHLQEVWGAVLAEAGVEATFHAGATTDAPADGLPQVSVVELPERESFSGMASGEDRSEEFGESTIAFLPDSPEFVDETAAREALAGAISALQADAGLTCTVEGATASSDGTEAGRAFVGRLSQQRADAVAALIGDAGVDASRIEAVGCADAHASHVPDRDGAGNLVPALAAENRKVIVTLHKA